MTSVAFLVVSHRAPRQVLRLVRALREAPQTTVHVRHDQRDTTLPRAELLAAGATPVDDGLTVDWGSPAYAQMLLRALREIQRREDPDWVAVLSGQDYPLRPVGEFVRHLAESPHTALLGDFWELEVASEPPPPRDDFYRRYAFRHYAPPAPVAAIAARALGRRAYLRVLPRGLGTRLGIRARHPFGPHLRPHVSSDWLTLERRALHCVLGFEHAHPRAAAHYRRTIVPSESLFATALANDPSISIGAPPRLLGFEDGSPHPRVLRSEHAQDLLSSGAHFARKFDEEVDAHVLDLLDEARARAQ